MPRKLKTYVTTSGFFELAVAAPSMKAALEIWGAGPDLFRRGYAKETDDPGAVKAAIAKPGVVLQRGVGSDGVFKEHANLPDISTLDKGTEKKRPSKRAAKAPQTAPLVDRVSEAEAAKLYDKAREKRSRAKARAEAEARKRRDNKIKKAEAALASAQADHDKRIAAIEKKIAEFEGKAREEDERWGRERPRFEEALRKLRR